MKLASLILVTLMLTTSAANATCGIASFYGGADHLCGHKTANGERLNCHAMTAAHRTLPFGTILHVRHNGRTVAVRINDRGPFIIGRILDLTIGVTRALGITGTAKVCY